jgi:hypothetical protein
MIAIRRVPVMIRLLERSPASPRTKQNPARATANEAALKREQPAGDNLRKARWKTTGREYLGGQ